MTPSENKSFDSLPLEMYIKILSNLPVRERMVIGRVDNKFRATTTSLVKSSEDIFRPKFIDRVTPREARLHLLKYTNLRLLNMDLATRMFPDFMTEEEIKDFAHSLSVNCPKIETVFMSSRTSFKIIALYCSVLEETPRISRIHAVIDSDETRGLLESIQSLCPGLQSLDVIDVPTNTDNCEESMADSTDETDLFIDTLDFDTFDPEEIACLHNRSVD